MKRSYSLEMDNMRGSVKCGCCCFYLYGYTDFHMKQLNDCMIKFAVRPVVGGVPAPPSNQNKLFIKRTSTR